MMKKTVCLLFVLVFVAQICATPTDTDAKKEVKGAADHAANAPNEAKKEATKLADGATNLEHVKGDAGSHKEGNGESHKEGNGEHHAEGNGGHHAKGAKHGGEGSKKSSDGLGPASNVIKKSEEFTKKMADQGVKLVTDILGLWKI